MTIGAPPNRGDPPCERACPAVHIAAAHRVRKRHVHGVAVVRLKAFCERVETRRWQVGGCVQLAPEMCCPVASGNAGALQPLVHTVRRDELSIVPELLAGGLESTRRQGETVCLGGDNTRVSVTRPSLDCLPLTPAPCRDDHVTPAICLSV